MNVKALSLLVLVALFLSVPVILTRQTAKADGTIYIRADGNVEGTDRIQRNGNTYTFTSDIYDPIIVEKSNITIDGNGQMISGDKNASCLNLPNIDHVTIKNVTIRNFQYGILMNSSSHCLISGNNIGSDSLVINSHIAVYANFSSHNNISDNTFINNENGIYLNYSSNNDIRGNNMKTNYNGIYLSSSLNNAICENNLEDGAIGIFVGNNSNQNTLSDNTVTHYQDAGIWLQTSTNNVVFGNILIDNEQGMTFRGSSNQNIIMNNTLARNYRGVDCHDSSENAIYRNNIIDSSWFNFRMVRSSRNMIYSNNILNSYFGFWLTSSTNNSFYHNNIIRNLDSALTPTNDPNIWDNGYPSGGNFWGDYAGIDSNSDGIGEISYNVSQGNFDRYPLMGLFNSLNTSVGKAVNIISNSTVEGFEFFGFNNTIHFSALNRTVHQVYGFCRVTVPHDVLPPPYVVTVDSEITSYETIFENETLSIIYFTYVHSQRDVVIASEFPLTLTLLIFMISILAVALVMKRRYIRNLPFL